MVEKLAVHTPPGTEFVRTHLATVTSDTWHSGFVHISRQIINLGWIRFLPKLKGLCHQHRLVSGFTPKETPNSSDRSLFTRGSCHRWKKETQRILEGSKALRLWERSQQQQQLTSPSAWASAFLHSNPTRWSLQWSFPFNRGRHRCFHRLTCPRPHGMLC